MPRRTDERHPRRNRISITRKGRDVLAAGLRVFQQVDDAMFAGFTPSEREQVGPGRAGPAETRIRP